MPLLFRDDPCIHTLICLFFCPTTTTETDIYANQATNKNKMKQPYGRMSTEWMPPKSVHIMATNHQKPFPLLSFLFFFIYVMYFPPLPSAPLNFFFYSFLAHWTKKPMSKDNHEQEVICL